MLGRVRSTVSYERGMTELLIHNLQSRTCANYASNAHSAGDDVEWCKVASVPQTGNFAATRRISADPLGCLLRTRAIASLRAKL